MAATKAELTKAAMRFLSLGPLPDGLDAFLAGFIIHGESIGLNGALGFEIDRICHDFSSPGVSKKP
jgi:hypothetical protein